MVFLVVPLVNLSLVMGKLLDMSTKITIFQFDCQEMRFVDGKPVANDVAVVLGYKNPADAVFRLVKDKNKGVCKIQTPGGVQSVMVLEEAGIYQLIFGSKLPSAEKFQDWVFEEVLPEIRKTGSFGVNQEKTHNLEWFNRLKLYKSKTKIEANWFSIFEEMTTSLIATFETNGYVLPLSSVPDISVGKTFCKYLRSIGINTDDTQYVKMYKHYYPDGRIVDANIYNVTLLPKYRVWFQDEYVRGGNKGGGLSRYFDYLGKKHGFELPTSICELLGLPENAQ